MGALMERPPVTTQEEIEATPERLRAALEDGGRATVTVRSRETGRHVTISFAAKKKGPDGRYVSRAKIDGRVGIREADTVFVDDPTLSWPDGKVATFTPGTGEWKPAKGADPARVWAAQRLIDWALARKPAIPRGEDSALPLRALEDQAEIFISLSCSFCGKRLTDPVSVERGVGPECWGRYTGSRSAERS